MLSRCHFVRVRRAQAAIAGATSPAFNFPVALELATAPAMHALLRAHSADDELAAIRGFDALTHELRIVAVMATGTSGLGSIENKPSAYVGRLLSRHLRPSICGLWPIDFSAFRGA